MDQIPDLAMDVFPPDDSDEDSEDDEGVLPKDINCLGRGQLLQEAELILYQDDQDEVEPAADAEGSLPKRLRPDGDVEEEEPDDATESRDKQKLGRTKNADRRWRDDKPQIYGMSVPDFVEQPLKQLPDGTNTPFDFYKLFVDDIFMDKVVELSNLYIDRKNRPDIKQLFTSNNLRIAHAIMYLTGYLSPANRNMFWERKEDTSNSLVKKAMTQRTFININSNTVFVEQTVPDPDDKYWKVRMLFNQLNNTAQQYVMHPASVSIDESMIKYFGPHPLKQFLRGKPCRFGYKVWTMASPKGELLYCQPYGGSATKIKDYGQGQGPNVVLGLSEQYGLLPGTKVYVDNLFTSLDLLEHMGERQLGVTGTMRMNRLCGVPLPTKKAAEKDMQRGESRSTYTQDAMVMVWRDSKPVYMASNHDQMEPMGAVQRFSKADKRYIEVPQPSINKEYNSNMGGVDLLDQSEKNYAITTRVRKWYWTIYMWFLNISMVQAWRLYRAHMTGRHSRAAVGLTETEAEKRKRRVEEKKTEEVPLLDFTRLVVEMLFKTFTDPSRAEPQRTSMLRVATLAAVRHDNGRHLVRLTEARGVCKQCHNRTRFRCTRCDVALHPEECFYLFHTS